MILFTEKFSTLNDDSIVMKSLLIINKFDLSIVWSALPATSVQLRTVLIYSHTSHMPQPTLCSPVANSQQVAKLGCIKLRNVTPWLIRAQDLDHQSLVL